MTEPTLYRSKDVVAAMAWGSAGGKKEWKESGFRPPPIYDSPLTVQQRIIHLVQRGVVNATKVEGSGVSSVRWYDFDAVVEIALALDMQRFGYPWMHMKRVIDKYRENSRVSDKSTNFIVIVAAPYGEAIFFPDDLKTVIKAVKGTADKGMFSGALLKAYGAPGIQERVREMSADGGYPAGLAFLSTAILVLNVAAWRTHLQAQLGEG